MITAEHLEHWLTELKYQLNGILQEIATEKVQMTGINVGKTGEAFVSFEYLQEKANTLHGVIGSIEWDIIHDTGENFMRVEKIMKELRYRKQHPQAFNYAQFERWITDILAGGDGFPLPTKEEMEGLGIG